MEIIDELESVRRGLYGGATGYIDFSGDMDFCYYDPDNDQKEKPCIFAGWSGNSCRFPFRKMSTRSAAINVMALAKTLIEEENL